MRFCCTSRYHGRPPAPLVGVPRRSVSPVLHATGRFAGHPRVVRDSDDLTALLRAGRHAARTPIVLELEHVDDAEAARTSARLAELANECGCAWGARAMTAGFVVSAVAVVRPAQCRSASFPSPPPLRR